MSRKKTAAEHKANGSYKPCRHAGRADLKAPAGRPKLPNDLSAAATKFWRRVVPEIDAGLVGAIDSDNLAAMARWFVCWDEALKAGDTLGAKRAWEPFAKLASRYGLDPQSRQALSVPPKKPESGLVKILEASRG